MKLLAAAAFLATASAASAPAEDPSFVEWAVMHRKSYATAEERTLRRNIYYQTVAKIAAHNASGKRWTARVNRFSDLTTDEWRSRYTGGVKARQPDASRMLPPVTAEKVAALPASVDWVAKGAVTPVQDQGSCGSCWSFSTTGSVEGINYIKTGKLIKLSEQQLIDCTTGAPYKNLGCNGGDIGMALDYVANSKGLCTEAAYPYDDEMYKPDDDMPHDDLPSNDPTGTGTCQATGSSPCTPAATITNYTYVTPGSMNDLMAAVAVQPVSIAVYASDDWQNYYGGVLDGNCSCSTSDLNHGVLLTGYTSDPKNGDYWVVKNSWDVSWGENGYIWLAKGEQYNPQGVSGLQLSPIIPIKTDA